MFLYSNLHVVLHQVIAAVRLKCIWSHEVGVNIYSAHKTLDEGHVSVNVFMSDVPYLSVSLMLVHHPSSKGVWYQYSSEGVIKYARIGVTTYKAGPDFCGTLKQLSTMWSDFRMSFYSAVLWTCCLQNSITQDFLKIPFYEIYWCTFAGDWSCTGLLSLITSVRRYCSK